MSKLHFTKLRRGQCSGDAVPLLGVRRLTVRVGIRRVLEDLDLDVFEGDTVCISGPNGSGKSSLLNAIAGLEPARVEAGTIFFEGHDITDLPAHERARRGLAYLRQRDNVFPDLSVDENLRLAVGSQGPRDFRREFPSWADGLPGRKRVGLLSGGQKQRLAWAMASLRPSRVLLADEPEAGMSSRTPTPTTTTLLFVGHASHAVARYCEEAIQRWRQGVRPTDEDAWAMADLPCIEELRKLVRCEDRPWLWSMLHDPSASIRRLAVNLGGAVADDEMQREVSKLWKQEPHLHTKLSMVFFLAYSVLLDWSEVMGFLEGRREEVVALILNYFQNYPRGSVAAIAERISDPAYASSRVLYLFTLRELARRGELLPSRIKSHLQHIETCADQLLARLARDVRDALEAQEEPVL